MMVNNADVLSTLVVIVYIHVGAIVTQEDPESATLVNCSFEDGMCDWDNISAGWKTGRGSLTTSGIGPAHDHTIKNASGIYAYLGPGSVNASQPQVLRSPIVPWNDSCLSLWYHMRGNDTGNLTVSIETQDTTTAISFSTTQSGNRTILWSQEGELEDKWHSVEITIQTQEAFVVLLEGTTEGQRGIIAVDDIIVSKCCCKGICGFDVGFCNWIQMTSDGFRWIRRNGSSSSTKTGPLSGHTNKTVSFALAADDYYIYIDASLGNESSKAVIRHTGLYRPGPVCVSFWYHMYGKDMGKLNLYAPGKGYSVTPVWCKKGDQGNNWISAAVDVNVGPNASVEFEAVRGNGSRGDIALDDISLTIGYCNGTWTTSTARDLKESTFSVGWEEANTNTTWPAEISVTEHSTIGSERQTTAQGHIRNATGEEKVSVGVITVSLVGAVMLVVLSLLVGVWIYRKRRRYRKKVEPFDLQPIASNLSSREDERGDYSSAAHCINPVYEHSLNDSRTCNTAMINVKTDNENYEYASAFTPTTPIQWTDDTYDTTCDETKPHFDATYDHMLTQCIEEYDSTHLTMHERQDANEAYDQVTICPDDVYDETCVAQATAIQDKSYDHVTRGICETPVSKQNISNSQDNIYELIE